MSQLWASAPAEHSADCHAAPSGRNGIAVSIEWGWLMSAIGTTGHADCVAQCPLSHRQSGRHLLVASISPFDPSALVHGVGQDALAARIDEADRPAIRRAVND
jgi:hypothetical protein